MTFHHKLFNIFKKPKIKAPLTIEQQKNQKKFYICLGVIAFATIAILLFAMFGFAAYKYPVDHDGQFLNQPGLVFINFSENYGQDVGELVTNGGVAGQTVGVYIAPFVSNASVRFMLAMFCVISFLIFLAASMMGFFYLMNAKNPPVKKSKDKYKDSIKLNKKK